MGNNVAPKELEDAGCVLSAEHKRCSPVACVLVALPVGSLHAVHISQDSHEGIILSGKVENAICTTTSYITVCRYASGPREIVGCIRAGI